MPSTHARRARRLSAAAFAVAALATLGYWAAPPGLLTRTVPTFAGLAVATVGLLLVTVAVWLVTAAGGGA